MGTKNQAILFRDREDAARQLAAKLGKLKDQHPLVLAIPRGGVPMGRSIADAINGEFDIVLVRKLRAPGHPEFSVGAVDEHGAPCRLPTMPQQWEQIMTICSVKKKLK